MALLSAISDILCSIPLPKSANVAVIHNEARVREQALSALRDAGHGVSGFADPMKALDAISSISYPRVLVTGIHFGKGKVHGIALARMVRFKWPTTGVVFIGRPENQPHADGLGELLAAPLDPQALVDAVGRSVASVRHGRMRARSQL